jgi:hypothetical protein
VLRFENIWLCSVLFALTNVLLIPFLLLCGINSDIHADTERNRQWITEHCVRSVDDANNDVFTVFIVPGDIGSDLQHIVAVLNTLVKNFDAVSYIPGNHEAWCRTGPSSSSGMPAEEADSVKKLAAVLQAAVHCGAYVGPLRVQVSRAGSVGEPHGGPTFSSSFASPDPTLCSKQHNIEEECGTLAPGISSGNVANTMERLASRLSGVSVSASVSATTANTTTAPAPALAPAPAASASASATPAIAPGVVIMPLYGWYHSGWDTEPAITDPLFLRAEALCPFHLKWGDFRTCHWPGILSKEAFTANHASCTVLPEVFAKLNEPFLFAPPTAEEKKATPAASVAAAVPPSPPVRVAATAAVVVEEEKEAVAAAGNVRGKDGATAAREPCKPNEAKQYLGSPCALHPADTVVSHSHFLPRVELCPEKRFLMEPGLAGVIGR